MTKLKIIAVLLFVLAINLLGCTISDSGKTITVNELKNEMKSDTSLVILDVRRPDELTGPLGKINGVINIPVQELEQRVNELKKYKDKNIAVICRSGHRSHIGMEILLKHGYNAHSVQGGMIKYRESEKSGK